MHSRFIYLQVSLKLNTNYEYEKSQGRDPRISTISNVDEEETNLGLGEQYQESTGRRRIRRKEAEDGLIR